MEFPTFEQENIIDQEQFDMLVETGEDEAAELLNELLELFEEETGQIFESFKAEAANGNKEAVAKTAHSIAGASGNLGGLRLSKAARHLENNIDQIIDMGPVAALIEKLYNETITVYKSKIAAL